LREKARGGDPPSFGPFEKGGSGKDKLLVRRLPKEGGREKEEEKRLGSHGKKGRRGPRAMCHTPSAV